MTVKELIEALKHFPQNAEVLSYAETFKGSRDGIFSEIKEIYIDEDGDVILGETDS